MPIPLNCIEPNPNRERTRSLFFVGRDSAVHLHTFMYVYTQSIACPSCSVKNRSARFSDIFLCKFTSVLFPPGKAPVFLRRAFRLIFSTFWIIPSVVGVEKTNYNKSTDIPVILAEWCFWQEKSSARPARSVRRGQERKEEPGHYFAERKLKRKEKEA